VTSLGRGETLDKILQLKVGDIYGFDKGWWVVSLLPVPPPDGSVVADADQDAAVFGEAGLPDG